jgi:hypothetical protein
MKWSRRLRIARAPASVYVRQRRSIGVEQYPPYARGKDLRFTGTRAGNHHHRTLDLVHGLPLLLVQPFIFTLKLLIEFVP